MSEEHTESIELGGNISLVGFKEFDHSEMIVVKKIVGNYARKLSERCKAFEQLMVRVKTIHKQEHSEKYELQAKLIDGGQVTTTEITDHNFFIALDSVLKKIMAAVGDK